MIRKIMDKIRDWLWYRESMKVYRLSTSKNFVEAMAKHARIPMEIFGDDEGGWFMCPKMSEEARKEFGRKMRKYYSAPYVRSKDIIDLHVKTPLDKPIQ